MKIMIMIVIIEQPYGTYSFLVQKYDVYISLKLSVLLYMQYKGWVVFCMLHKL